MNSIKGKLFQGKSLEEEFEEVFSVGEIGDDEYLNMSDGLIHCRKCNTARQFRYEFAGRVYAPRVMCACQKADYDREEAERKQRELANRITFLKADGLQDTAYRNYIFANDNGQNPKMSTAHAYVDNLAEMKKNSSGLLLWGDVGTGKTFFAGCIANALLEQGVPVLMTNFARILNTLTGMYSSDKNIFVDSLNKYSLLIIDDLGAERNSDFALEQVFSVVDTRYRSGKPLIVTTNLTIEEIKNASDLARKRIYSRILERCVPLRINGKDIRQENAAANMNKVKSILTE